MRALILNATLKKSPADSNTEALARVVGDHLAGEGVAVDAVRLVDLDIAPGVTADEGDGDQWPQVHRQILDADILILATPTWLGQPSSVMQRALERMDSMISQTDDDGRPVAYGKVAGIVVTGNEDGAHHIIANVAQAVIDIGFTVPGQAWTYWNKGPGPGEEEYSTSDETEWSDTTGRQAAKILLTVARAFDGVDFPIPEG
jgi:multimeric flavodoxin WrbA